MTTLSETCDWINGEGVVSCLTYNFNVPWADSVDGQTLDDDYYGNRSGSKYISPLADKFLTDGKLDASKTRRLANIVFSKYGEAWARSWAALLEEYAPLDNYNMIEEETPSEYTRTTTPAKTKTTETPAETSVIETPAETTVTTTPAEITETDRPAGTTVTTTPAETTTTEAPAETTEQTDGETGISGFNSPDFVKDSNSSEAKGLTVNKAGETSIVVDSSETVVSVTDASGSKKIETDTPETVQTVTNTNGITNYTTVTAGETVNEALSPETERFEVDANRRLTRHGNIGVTTSQQMLESEIDLRTKYSFFDNVVFPTIDKVMCLSIFKCEY